MQTSFSGAVTVVTGGASGIGRELCEQLARKGAIVVVADINGAQAQVVSDGINATGGRAEVVQVDVAQVAEVERLVNETAQRHGRIDYMFNNAGIGVAAEFSDLSLEHWRHLIDVNSMGVLYGTRAAYAIMREQGSGHIVNMASLAGLVPKPDSTPYTATKHAVVGFTRALRMEAAQYGVRASVLCPGFVRTPFYDAAITVNVDPTRAFGQKPLGQVGVHAAVTMFLKGVQKNRGLIVYPRRAKLLWYLDWFFPRLTDRIGMRMAREFRALHADRDS